MKLVIFSQKGLHVVFGGREASCVLREVKAYYLEDHLLSMVVNDMVFFWREG